VHVPIEPVTAQDRQAPLQAVSQQTPSAQKPLSHCRAQEHSSPFARASGVQVAALMSGRVAPSRASPPPPSTGLTTSPPDDLHAAVKTISSSAATRKPLSFLIWSPSCAHI